MQYCSLVGSIAIRVTKVSMALPAGKTNCNFEKYMLTNIPNLSIIYFQAKFCDPSTQRFITLIFFFF